MPSDEAIIIAVRKEAESQDEQEDEVDALEVGNDPVPAELLHMCRKR